MTRSAKQRAAFGASEPGRGTGSDRSSLCSIEDDRALLELVLLGDQGARASFVERFARLVFASVEATLRRHQRRPREDQVDEVFGEVFVALFDRDARRLRLWSGRCSLASWVRLVATSVTVDRLRRERGVRAAETTDGTSESIPCEGPEALEVLVRAEELAALGRAVATLSEPDQALLTALFVDEVSPGELATRLGVLQGALYTRKNRALERLRAAMAKQGRNDL